MVNNQRGQKPKNGYIYCGKCYHKTPLTVSEDDDYRYTICSNKRCNQLILVDLINDYVVSEEYINKNYRLNKEDIDELIDMALQTRDRRWFNQLVKRKNAMTNKWWEGQV